MNKKKIYMNLFYLSMGYISFFANEVCGTKAIKDTENSFQCQCGNSALVPICAGFVYASEDQCENGDTRFPASCSYFCTVSPYQYNVGNCVPYVPLPFCAALPHSLTEKKTNQKNRKGSKGIKKAGHLTKER